MARSRLNWTLCSSSAHATATAVFLSSWDCALLGVSIRHGHRGVVVSLKLLVIRRNKPGKW